MGRSRPSPARRRMRRRRIQEETFVLSASRRMVGACSWAFFACRKYVSRQVSVRFFGGLRYDWYKLVSSSCNCNRAEERSGAKQLQLSVVGGAFLCWLQRLLSFQESVSTLFDPCYLVAHCTFSISVTQCVKNDVACTRKH